ncbi:hypothetical protein J1614_011300 [Plenodomus biglobosus]|nr:hypothetical protein J1614_011300 [Plenodomus biglobosus]
MWLGSDSRPSSVVQEFDGSFDCIPEASVNKTSETMVSARSVPEGLLAWTANIRLRLSVWGGKNRVEVDESRFKRITMGSYMSLQGCLSTAHPYS